MKIEIDKLLHFVAGIIGYMYFRYIRAYPVIVSHLVVFTLGYLWEVYWKWKINEKIDLWDWGFVCIGSIAVYLISLNSWIYSTIGYLICLFMYLKLKEIWF
jgi:hypothetical protein